MTRQANLWGPRVRKQPRAKKVRVDDVVLDSKAEARRYGELRLQEKAGQITDLEVHPTYELVVNGYRIGKYTVDFRYKRDGRMVVEDVKGGAKSDPNLRAVKLKIKLVRALYGVDVELVHP